MFKFSSLFQTSQRAFSPSAQINSIENARVVATHKQTTPGNIKGGIAGSSLPDTFHQYRGTPAGSGSAQLACATNIDYLAQVSGDFPVKGGVYVYGGPIVYHFGHFLAECIHRAWGYEYAKEVMGLPVKKIVFQPRNRGILNRPEHPLIAFPSHFQYVLSYLGIPRRKITLQYKHAQYEKLIVPQQASFFRAVKPVSDNYLAFLTRCEEKAGLAISPNAYPEKIYVSRQRFLMRGAAAGEAYVEKFLEQNGFAIFYPEDYPVKEQLNHYKHAKQIVFAEGGALHLLELLGNTKAEVFVLKRRKNSDKVFQNIIAPRVSRLAFSNGTDTLPSLFIPNASASPAHGSALSWSEVDEFASFFQDALEITAPFDKAAFVEQAKIDVRLYLNNYKENLLNSDIGKQQIERFTAECNKRINGGLWLG